MEEGKNKNPLGFMLRGREGEEVVWIAAISSLMINRCKRNRLMHLEAILLFMLLIPSCSEPPVEMISNTDIWENLTQIQSANTIFTKYALLL